MKKIIVGGITFIILNANFTDYASAYFKKDSFNSNPVYVQDIQRLDSLTNSLESLGKQYINMQVQALVMLKEPAPKIESVPSLTEYHNTTNEVIKKWLDENTQDFINTNEDIQNIVGNIRYVEILSEQSRKIHENMEEKNAFQDNLEEMKQDVDDVLVSLRKNLSSLEGLYKEIESGQKKFSDDFKDKILQLSGFNQNIVNLQNAIKTLEDEIEEERQKAFTLSYKMIDSAIEMGTITFKMVKVWDLKGLGSAYKFYKKSANLPYDELEKINNKINSKIEKLRLLTKNLSKSELEVAQATVVDKQFDNFKGQMGKQIEMIRQLVLDWEMFRDRVKKVGEAFDKNNKKNLQQQLMELQRLNDNLNNQTKLFEQYMRNIRIEIE
ncbi:HBL/NHE enterotoxin family protein [Bacillus cytotoxicus]|uniref:HBL/NHE enterotoxin family protein n=1 Tax=Bacillus cytotoxicus TaxID=580165 RepID=UPI0008643EF9|nr:HBL/NHE enterotoxin family protein [Bacillus cytotoxicus]AWC27371.1 hypothetical protein CG483_002415 [Bacillus cytotoxicus]AWC41255.1 hypothetical protein CG480_012840 [Bacillus cytotoxicus]AWC49186.1 hypothetical protein CG478_012840 [Bacillus cytotoxicus]AWC51437.1 hypothetical protein CG477_002410 [Bacillus cytotoxicus]AWC55566.1 hypothetical protein CG476_002410 [Bacillus cytotoxicus]